MWVRTLRRKRNPAIIKHFSHFEEPSGGKAPLAIFGEFFLLISHKISREYNQNKGEVVTMDRQTLEWDDSAYSLMIQCKRAQNSFPCGITRGENASSPAGLGSGWWIIFTSFPGEERETRTALKSQPQGGPGWLFSFLGTAPPPLGRAELQDLILMEDSRSRLTVEQLEQVALSLKVAYLLAVAADAFGEEGGRGGFPGGPGPSSSWVGWTSPPWRNWARWEETLWEGPAGIYPRMTVESRRQYRRTRGLDRQAAKGKKEETSGPLGSEPSPCRRRGSAPATWGYPLRHQVRWRRPAAAGGETPPVGRGLLPLALSLAGGLVGKTGGLSRLPPSPVGGVRPALQRLCPGRRQDGLPPRMELTPGSPRCAVVVTTLCLPLPEWGTGGALEQLYLLEPGGKSGVLRAGRLSRVRPSTAPEDDSKPGPPGEMIEELNSRWGSRFLLALRPRTYLRQEDLYRGWERKQGRPGGMGPVFEGLPGHLAHLLWDAALVQDCPLVIALDSDTQLLFGSAKADDRRGGPSLNR